MNWKRTIIVLLLAAPLPLVLLLAFQQDPNALPSALVGQRAPKLDLKTLDGQTFDWNRVQGKPMFINFWSTWCEPCKAEHHIIQAAAQKYGDSITFVGVVYQDSASAAARYLQQRGNAFVQLDDPGSRVAIEFGVSGVPESFFVDAQGLVQHKETGPVSMALMEGLLARLQATPLRADRKEP